MEAIFQEEVAKLKAAGKSILLSSHILSEVERLADKVVIIREGQVVESGTLDEMRHLTRSQVILASDEDVSVLGQVAGVHDFSQKGQEVTFAIDNKEINTLLGAVAKFKVTKFEVVPPTLEDLFIRHYEK